MASAASIMVVPYRRKAARTSPEPVQQLVHELVNDPLNSWRKVGAGFWGGFGHLESPVVGSAGFSGH